MRHEFIIAISLNSVAQTGWKTTSYTKTLRQRTLQKLIEPKIGTSRSNPCRTRRDCNWNIMHVRRKFLPVTCNTMVNRGKTYTKFLGSMKSMICFAKFTLTSIEPFYNKPWVIRYHNDASVCMLLWMTIALTMTARNLYQNALRS